MPVRLREGGLGVGGTVPVARRWGRLGGVLNGTERNGRRVASLAVSAEEGKTRRGMANLL